MIHAFPSRRSSGGAPDRLGSPPVDREALIALISGPRSLVCVVTTLLLSSSPAFGQEAWPTSCRQKRATIFDRPVKIVDTLRAVPAVERWERELGLEGRRVRAGEVEIWVEEAGAGVPLVLLSGGPGTSHHYFHPDLFPAAAFSRLIWFDPRGVGRSEFAPGDGYSIHQAVEDLEALRRALGYERWALFGFSFGGVVAQVYALRHPERVLGLILGSSAVPMDLDVGLGQRQRAFMDPREVERVAEIYALDGEPVVPARSERVDAETQRRMLFNGFLNGDWKRRHLCRMPADEIARFARYEFVHDAGYYHRLVADHRALDLGGAFRDSPLPTLILEGKWDLAFMPRKARLFASEFPRGELHVFENGGHVFYEDVPGEFFPVLREFLEGLEAPAPGEIRRWKERIRSAGYLEGAGGEETPDEDPGPDGVPSWQAANLSYLAGGAWKSRPATQDVLTVEYANRWELGDTFVFFEARNLLTRDPASSGTAGPVPTALYAEIQPRISLGRVLDRCLCVGPLRDVLTAHELNVSGGGLVAHLHGVGGAWEIPGIDFFKSNLYLRDDLDRPGATWQVLLSAAASPEIAGRRLHLGGYADVIGSEGDSSRSLYAEIQLLLDVGAELRDPGHLFVGAEIHGSVNHLGRAGVDQLVPQAMLRWVY